MGKNEPPLSLLILGAFYFIAGVYSVLRAYSEEQPSLLSGLIFLAVGIGVFTRKVYSLWALKTFTVLYLISVVAIIIFIAFGANGEFTVNFTSKAIAVSPTFGIALFIAITALHYHAAFSKKSVICFTKA